MKKDVISTMFFSSAVAMIFTQLAGYCAVLIDGIITSRALGPDAYSAISLLWPFTGVILLLSGSISTGNQVVSSNLVGAGEKEKANSAFSLSIILVMLFAALLLIGCVVMPGQMFRICGVSLDKHPELYAHMLDYLHGYMIGVPFMMLIQIIGPMIVIDNSKILFTNSAFVLCICDIIGDILNAYVFHGGTFGMGLATSISYVIQLLIIMTHFLKKNCYFHFSFRALYVKQIKEIFQAASPTFVSKFATTLRDLLINRINLMVALTTAAIAARGMQNDLNTVLFCIGLGISKTLITMTGIYYSADDRQGLTRLFSYAMKMSVIFAGTAGLISFFGAEYIAKIFSTDPEFVSLAVFSIQCMALGLIPDTLAISFQNYLQGIKNRKLVNVMNFCERFFIPVLTAYVLGINFGSKGIMASIAVGKFILIFMMFIIVCVHCKAFPKKWSDFMFLPADFGGNKSNNMYASIKNINDVMKTRDETEDFCVKLGMTDKKAKLIALFVEEMAGNIVQHGITKKKRPSSVEFRLFVKDEKVCITLRDCCGYFDPVAFYNAHNNENPENMTGIRIVTKLAKEIRYFNAFNSNNIIIYSEQ